MLRNYIPFFYIFILSYSLSIYKIYGISNNIIITIALIIAINFFTPKIKFQINYILYSFILVLVILISYTIGEIFYSIYSLGSVTESIYLIILIFLFLTFIKIINPNNINQIINIMIFFGVLVSFYLIIQFITYVFYSYELYPPFCNTDLCGFNYKLKPKFGYSDGLLRANAFFDSTNRVASFLTPCAIFCLLKLKLSSKKIYFFYFIITTTAIFCNLSRSGIFSYFIAIIFFIILNKRNKLNFKSIFLLIFYLIISLLIVTFTYFSFFNSKLEFTRFFIFSGQNLSNFFYVIENFFHVILISFSNLGFGVGYHIVNEYTFRVLDLKYWGLHSNLLEIIGGVGFWFISIFILYLYILFKKIRSLNFKFSTTSNEYLFLINSLVAILFALLFLGIVRTYFISTFTILVLALLDRSIYFANEKK